MNSYSVAEPAVLELVLLAHNAPTREGRFKAMRALEWLDPATANEPPPAGVAVASGPVEEAIEAVRWTLYGWDQSSRARAAARAGELIAELAAMDASPRRQAERAPR